MILSRMDLGRDISGLSDQFRSNALRVGRRKYALIENWQPAQLENGWTTERTYSYNPDNSVHWMRDYNAHPLQFFRDPEGFVHMRGVAKVISGGGLTITYLPSRSKRHRGYRPEKVEDIPVTTRRWWNGAIADFEPDHSGARQTIATIDPYSGSVQVGVNDPTWDITIYEYVSFDGVGFWAAL